eukprot:TRINITY_DN20190_c0_g1_i1.p1 TRINITY_DN20190_c0_g1~~TRINITY_DN20190_c0_g1_i1.p1  ORF type:complete len:294 (+),score=42.46 TRINITY_DN20190_c0_g1_i1:86-967(+)
MFVIIFSAARGAHKPSARGRASTSSALSDTEGIAADRLARKELRGVRRQLVAQTISTNRSLPRWAGPLIHTRHGVFRDSEARRWAVLDPAAATLSLWCAPPQEYQVAIAALEDNGDYQEVPDSAAQDHEICAICLETLSSGPPVVHLGACGHGFHRTCLRTWRAERYRAASACVGATCPSCRAPLGDLEVCLRTPDPPKLRPFSDPDRGVASCRGCAARVALPQAAASRQPAKLLPLEMLEEVDSNRHFRNMFLHFEGESSVVTLTAESDADFWSWLQIFKLYAGGVDLATEM